MGEKRSLSIFTNHRHNTSMSEDTPLEKLLCKLLELPVELFIQITRNLDPTTVDLINLRATCRDIRRVINSDQYHYFALHSGRYRWAFGENFFAPGKQFNSSHDYLNDINGHIFADQCKYCLTSPSRAAWHYFDEPFQMVCRSCFVEQSLG